MKTLFNSRGVSLVILVIAMTIIAILGASFVSLVGMKQRGFLHQNDSYRAFNIANAGIEYAIRYVGDGIDPLGSNLDDFVHRPALFNNIKTVSSIPNTSNLSDTSQWKEFDFGNGKFYISFYLNSSDPDNIESNKILYSVGVFNNAQRIIILRNFLTYASPTSSAGLDKLNLVPNLQPYIAGPNMSNLNYVVIPIINVSGNDITITSMQFEIDLANNLTNQFRDIYARPTNGYGGTNIYNYHIGLYPSNCSSNPAPLIELPCGQPGFIEIPDAPLPHTGSKMTISLNFSPNITISKSAIRWFSIRFSESGSNLFGTYTIKFNYSGGSSTVNFILP